MHLEALLTVPDPDGHGSRASIDFPGHDEFRLPVPDDIPRVCAPERPGAPEVGCGLQDARLARGVRAVDEVIAVAESDVDGFQAAKIRTF